MGHPFTPFQFFVPSLVEPSSSPSIHRVSNQAFAVWPSWFRAFGLAFVAFDRFFAFCCLVRKLKKSCGRPLVSCTSFMASLIVDFAVASSTSVLLVPCMVQIDTKGCCLLVVVFTKQHFMFGHTCTVFQHHNVGVACCNHQSSLTTVCYILRRLPIMFFDDVHRKPNR